MTTTAPIVPVAVLAATATQIKIVSAGGGPPPVYCWNLHDADGKDLPCGGSVAMSQTQWSAWASGGTPESDAAYIAGCVIANIPGLTAA